MDVEKKLIKTWISKSIDPKAYYWTLALIVLMQFFSFWLWSVRSSHTWWWGIPFEESFLLTKESLSNHQFWKLWTTLFIHQDIGHFLSNLVLFVPFSLLLAGHFGFWVFPFFTIVLSGLMNLLVISTMPEKVGLLGMSGAVYMMAGTWLTLNFFIERQESLMRRWMKISGIAIVLLVPTTISENVSYLSHGLGFVIGVFLGPMLFLLFKRQIRNSERYRYTYFVNDEDQFQFPLDHHTRH